MVRLYVSCGSRIVFMRLQQSSTSPRAVTPRDRMGPRRSVGLRPGQASTQVLPRADLSQLNDAMAGVANGMILRALSNPEVRAAIFDEIRTIVREELARTPFADRLVDAAEGAKIMGMTEAALRKAAARGTVPCEHRGRRLRFRLSALLDESEGRCGNQGASDAASPANPSATLP